MEKEIIGEKRISLIQFYGLTLIGILCVISSFFFKDFNVLAKGRFVIIALLPFIYFGYREIKNKEDYVGKIKITDNYLTITYKNNYKQDKLKKIKLSDIEKFTLDVNFNPQNYNSNSDLSQKVRIYHNNICTEFSIKPTQGIDWRKWSFSLRLLSIAKYIPNFSYTINSNKRGHFIKDDINYYYKNNKKYPYWLLILKDAFNGDYGNKFAIIILLLTIAFAIIFGILILFGIM